MPEAPAHRRTLAARSALVVAVLVGVSAASCQASTQAANGVTEREVEKSGHSCTPAQCRDEVLRLLDALERTPSMSRAEVEAVLGVPLTPDAAAFNDYYDEFAARLPAGPIDKVRLRAPNATRKAGPIIAILEARAGVPLRRDDFDPATLGPTMRLLPGEGGALVSVHRVDRPRGSIEFSFANTAWKSVTITRRRD